MHRTNNLSNLILFINSQDSADFPSFQIFAKYFQAHSFFSSLFFIFFFGNYPIDLQFMSLFFSYFPTPYLFILHFGIFCLFVFEHFLPTSLLISFSLDTCVLNAQELFLVFRWRLHNSILILFHRCKISLSFHEY